MRTIVLAAALAVLATPYWAEDTTFLLPEAGLYCPVGRNGLPILVDGGGGLLIDGLDCSDVRLEGGRLHSKACFANGGSTVSYDTDLIVLPSGAMQHDGIVFRRYTGPRPCPEG